MENILQYFGIGGIAFVLLSVLVEVTPIKINPISWIGKKLNGETLKSVEKINTKLDEHIAQSYRSKILNFQSKLIEKGISGHSKEEWTEVINACENYEQYIKDNNLNNGMCELAINYIKDSYVECLRNRDFANIPGRNAG